MKKIFSFLLVTVFIFVFCVSPVFASSIPVSQIKSGSGSAVLPVIDPSGKKQSAKLKTYNTFPFTASQAENSCDMLTETEKEIYDYFVNAPFGTLRFYREFDYFNNAEYNKWNDFTECNFENILTAVSYDCPELFYIEGAGWSWGLNDKNNDGYVQKGEKVFIEFSFSEINTDAYPDIYSLNEQLWAKVKSFDFSSCKTRYELVKAFHDTLCNIADYDTDFSNLREFDVIGCFIDGDCVCQGYAEAFKLLCNYYHIPCTTPSGTAGGGNHMWNAVQMDDGEWYLLDITWDDQTATYKIVYDYFLSGSQTTDEHFGGEIFSQSHIEQRGSVSPVITYSENSYASSPDSGFVNFTDNFKFDKLKNGLNVFISSPTEKEQVYFNGVCISRSTGYTFNYDGKDYVTCFTGDVNGDAFTDALDYSGTVNFVLSKSDVVTANTKAADICTDGVLDVLDITLVERLINSEISEINVK